jgi:hypothetical protein
MPTPRGKSGAQHVKNIEQLTRRQRVHPGEVKKAKPNLQSLFDFKSAAFPQLSIDVGIMSHQETTFAASGAILDRS